MDEKKTTRDTPGHQVRLYGPKTSFKFWNKRCSKIGEQKKRQSEINLRQAEPREGKDSSDARGVNPTGAAAEAQNIKVIAHHLCPLPGAIQSGFLYCKFEGIKKTITALWYILLQGFVVQKAPHFNLFA